MAGDQRRLTLKARTSLNIPHNERRRAQLEALWVGSCGGQEGAPQFSILDMINMMLRPFAVVAVFNTIGKP